jgi:hypothetical protein
VLRLIDLAVVDPRDEPVQLKASFYIPWTISPMREILRSSDGRHF